MTTPTEIECTLVITELDGNVSIKLQVPSGAEETVAGALAKVLFEQAGGMMELALAEPDVPTAQ